MKNLSIDLLKLVIVWAIAVFLIASCGRSAYANGVHPHGELALAGYKLRGAQSARAFFVRNISMRSHISMAKLWRDTFKCAGNLVDLSTNPFQLCHPHLVVNGKAPKLQGAHTHA